MYNTVTKVLESAEFKLRKTRSNSPNLCDSEMHKFFYVNESFKNFRYEVATVDEQISIFNTFLVQLYDRHAPVRPVKIF